MERLLPLIVKLRLPDGREFTVHQDIEERYASIQWSYWTEGNGSCDCNKMLFIEREHPVQLLPPDDDYRCGDTIELVELTVDGKDAEDLDTWP